MVVLKVFFSKRQLVFLSFFFFKNVFKEKNHKKVQFFFQKNIFGTLYWKQATTWEWPQWYESARGWCLLLGWCHVACRKAEGQNSLHSFPNTMPWTGHVWAGEVLQCGLRPVLVLPGPPPPLRLYILCLKACMLRQQVIMWVLHLMTIITYAIMIRLQYGCKSKPICSPYSGESWPLCK